KKGFREKTKAGGAGFGAQAPVFPENLRAEDLPGECLAVSGRLRVLSLGKIHHFGEGCACPWGIFSGSCFHPFPLTPKTW
nr:hypothetical protein [Desulfobacula sp.]